MPGEIRPVHLLLWENTVDIRNLNEIKKIYMLSLYSHSNLSVELVFFCAVKPYDSGGTISTSWSQIYQKDHSETVLPRKTSAAVVSENAPKRSLRTSDEDLERL